MIRPASPRAFTRALLASTALVGIGLVSAQAEPLPTGGQVASGGVSIGSPAGGALAIHQSSQTAIVNWQGFSVGQGHRVDIHQPNSQAAILNRVTGATPSTIAGQLNANGQVYLVNPNGVTIMRSGQVNAAGFVASSLAISDEDFRAGRRQFRGSGASAAVANHGAITIGRGGYAALIGGGVTNTGTIAVPMGRVGLGSGERATLDLSGDGFLQVAVPTRAGGRGALVRHSGTISADGGSVTLSAAAARDMARQAVNLSGVVEARSVAGRNGHITLSGDEGAVRVGPSARLDASGLDGGRVTVVGQRLDMAGTVDVSGARGGRARLKASESLALSGRVLAEGRTGRGGRVTATAPVIATHAALVEASGTAGGGTVRLGGGRLGQGPLARAERVTVDAASTIRANATVEGHGGDVVVLSDARTRFAGRIEARGGAQGGNGGEAEVSSKGVLSYDGTTILTAAKGRFGTLLLDPYNITIANGADTNQSGFAATGDDSVINAGTLQAALATANVTVSTGAAGSTGGQAGTITVAAPLTWSSGSLLTLTAANAIAVDAPITVAGGGQLALDTAGTRVGPTTQPLLSFGNGASITFAANANQGGQALTINGTGYALLRTLDDVRRMDLSGAFALAGYLDAAGTRFTTAVVAGGDGSGNSPTPFSGTLEGLGHTIANLTIDGGGNRFVGLIGRSTGTVRDLGMLGGSVTGASFVGGLVGSNNFGTVTQAYATGAVSGGSGSARVGGLASDVAATFGTATLPTSADAATAITATGASFTLDRAVTAGGGYAVNAAGGPLTLAANLTAAGQAVTLASTGTIVQASGAITAGTLTGSTQGAASFGSADNAIAALGSFTTGGGALTLTDNIASLGLVGTISTGAGTFTLRNTGGASTQTAGTITAGMLTGSTQGAASFASAENAIAALGPFSAAGSLTLADSVGTLTLQGTIAATAADATLTLANAGDVTLAGGARVSAPGAVTLAATGAFVNHAGSDALASPSGYGLAFDTTKTVTVPPRAVTLSGTQVYDGTTDVSAASLSVTNLVPGDIAGLSGSGTMTSRDAGTNTLASRNGALAGLRLSNDNYTLTGGASTITVTGASGVGKTYDGTTALQGGATGYTTSAFATGDAGRVAVSGSAVYDSADAGSRVVSVSGLGLTGAAAGNYVLSSTSVTGTGTISPALVTVTANGGRSVYGDTPVNPGLSATGLVGGQDASVLTGLSSSFGLDATSAAGEYRLTVTGRLGNGNYRVGATEAGRYTVDRRTLTVTADALTRVYGDADPVLTYTLGGRGLANGDRLTGALATAADANSEPGLYRIMQGSLAAPANYSLGFVGADLTVLPAPAQPRPEPRTVALDPSGLASTAERAARLDASPIDPALPLLLGSSPDGALRVTDPRFDATLACTGQQGGCFLTPFTPAPAPPPRPQAGLSAR